MSLVALVPAHPPAAAESYVGRIPVRNMWLLMLYASDLFRTRGIGKVGLEDSPDDLPDLVAEILTHSVERRQRRRLSQGYQSPRRCAQSRARSHRRAPDRASSVAGTWSDRMPIRRTHGRYGAQPLRPVRAGVDWPDRQPEGPGSSLPVTGRGHEGPGSLRQCAHPSRAERRPLLAVRDATGDRFMVAAASCAVDLALPAEALGSNLLSLAEREAVWVRRFVRTSGWRLLRRDLEPPELASALWAHPRLADRPQDPRYRSDPAIDANRYRSRPRGDWPAHRHRYEVHVHRDSRLAPRRDSARDRSTVYQIYAHFDLRSAGATHRPNRPAVCSCTPLSVRTWMRLRSSKGTTSGSATVDLSASSSAIRTQLMRMTEPIQM